MCVKHREPIYIVHLFTIDKVNAPSSASVSSTPMSLPEFGAEQLMVF